MQERVRQLITEGQLLRGTVFVDWLNQRKETLKSRISAHDVFQHFGVSLNSSGEAQICCPFHGDSSPSARIYPSVGDSSSGVYCWVCRKRWDIFGLWKEFSGDPQMKFTLVLYGLEKAFGITTPDLPELGADNYPVEVVNEAEQVALAKLQVCEKRLRLAKPYFQLRGFLTVGKLLDNLHYQLKHRRIDPKLAEKSAQLILDKIGEKTRVA